MILVRDIVRTLARDAAVTFGPSRCPTLPTDRNGCDAFTLLRDGNDGFEHVDKEDYKGLSILLGLALIVGGATYLCAIARIGPTEYVGIVSAIGGYLFGKGTK